MQKISESTVASFLEASLSDRESVPLLDLESSFKTQFPNDSRPPLIDFIRESLFDSFEVFTDGSWMPCVRSLRVAPVEYIPLTSASSALAEKSAVDEVTASFLKELTTYVIQSPSPFSSFHDVLTSLNFKPADIQQIFRSARIAAFLDNSFLDALAMKFTVKFKADISAPSSPPPPTPAAAAAPPKPLKASTTTTTTTTTTRPVVAPSHPDRQRPSGYEAALAKAQAKAPRPAVCVAAASLTETAGNFPQLVQTLQLACLCGGVVAEHEVRELLRAMRHIPPS